MDDMASHQAWREAVEDIADKARATLPDCIGRVDAAVKMVLAGDVELLADGKAKVRSQSNGRVAYHVVNGECTCKDFPKAPSHWCKHRIAYGLAKRARTLTERQLAERTETPDAPAPAQPEAPTAPLPEAPASVNVHLTIGGRQVQLTLRDSDESRLLVRLDAVLQRFPVTDKPADDTPQCSKHGVPLKQQHGKDGSTWYSHKTLDGWCKGT